MKKLLMVMAVGLVFAGCTQQLPRHCDVSYSYVDPLQILNRHNDFRSINGLLDFTYDDKLEKAAQDHVDWMARVDKLSHTDARGKSVADRVGMKNWKIIGENIAYGYVSTESLMSGWMSSGGHKQNILRSSFTHIGIGMSYSKDGIPYYCVVFAG